MSTEVVAETLAELAGEFEQEAIHGGPYAAGLVVAATVLRDRVVEALDHDGRRPAGRSARTAPRTPTSPETSLARKG